MTDSDAVALGREAQREVMQMHGKPGEAAIQHGAVSFELGYENQRVQTMGRARGEVEMVASGGGIGRRPHAAAGVRLRQTP